MAKTIINSFAGFKKKPRSKASSQSSIISTEHLKHTLEKLKNMRHKESTNDKYHSIWTKFNNFVIRLDNKKLSWEERVVYYCTHLIYECNTQSSTIKSYVSAIKDILRADGYEWTDNKMLMTSLVASAKTKNDFSKSKLPIQKGLLDIILYSVEKKYRDKQPYLEVLYKNIFAFLYYGLFRIGEVTKGSHPIKAQDINLADNKDKLLVLLYSSKTHGRESRPQAVKICRINGGSGYPNNKRFYCPFRISREYLALRGNYSYPEEPLFIFSDGTPVKPSSVRSLLKSILKNLGLNADLYGTHSFRIGRATDLMKTGKTIDHIKSIGRWKSNAVYRYLRDL